MLNFNPFCAIAVETFHKVIPPPLREVTDDPAHPVEREFARYLEQERGLGQQTIRQMLHVARRFLLESLGPSSTELSKLGPEHVRQFTLQHARRLKRRSTQTVLSALKGFLRFLYQRGETSTDLADSVLKIACWRLSSLPKFITVEEVERLLRCVDRDTATGLRDYAILLLLARLGLRAGEVTELELGDINWAAGELTVRGKSARQGRLPILHDVGEAISGYLRHGRPRCASRRVFIRVQAPLRGFKSCATVGTIVKQYVLRAGLSPNRKGAHLLRHSLATAMLRGGGSLAEIGEVLRHQHTSTTEVYAKVHLSALQGIAQPWPGGDR